MIPPPPDIQPTIIQMQNVEDVKFDINLNTQRSSEQLKKRKRRSSSSIVSQSEIEKRRREHKTAHSIIEKKRRIRMNREFEALKYLIPACRSNLSPSNNNGEGMYKLTILQAAVDYIKYLHKVINIQNNLIKINDSPNNDLEFADFNIDTDAYRDVEQEFDFNKLFEEAHQRQSTPAKDKYEIVPGSFINCSTKVSDRTAPNLQTITYANDSTDDSLKLSILPSPIITPELYPRSSNSSNSSISSTSQIAIPQINVFQEAVIKSNYQFPKVMTTSSQLPRRPILSSSEADMTFKLNPLSEMTLIVDKRESSSINALLSMKKDNDITSIKSLLN